MFGQGLFSWSRTPKTVGSEENVQPTWDPKTLTMTQPQSPAAPTTENVVTNQPVRLLNEYKPMYDYVLTDCLLIIGAH